MTRRTSHQLLKRINTQLITPNRKKLLRMTHPQNRIKMKSNCQQIKRKRSPRLMTINRNNKKNLIKIKLNSKPQKKKLLRLNPPNRQMKIKSSPQHIKKRIKAKLMTPNSIDMKYLKKNMLNSKKHPKINSMKKNKIHIENNLRNKHLESNLKKCQ